MAGCDMESQMSGISPQQVRLGFIRKVYGIVCAQVTATSIFAGACVAGPLREPMVAFAQHRPGLLQWGTLIASLLALLLCRVGKDRYPLNLVGLGLLTLVMAVDVGVISAMVSSIGLGMLVVEAALITGLLTAGLTLYTFRSKRDFSFLGAALWPLLFALCCFSLLSVFFPSLRMGWMNLIVSFAGAAIFCGYIVFDTWRICSELKVDDYVEGAIQLYMDIVNLFLYILRILLEIAAKRD